MMDQTFFNKFNDIEGMVLPFHIQCNERTQDGVLFKRNSLPLLYRDYYCDESLDLKSIVSIISDCFEKSNNTFFKFIESDYKWKGINYNETNYTKINLQILYDPDSSKFMIDYMESRGPQGGDFTFNLGSLIKSKLTLTEYIPHPLFKPLPFQEDDKILDEHIDELIKPIKSYLADNSYDTNYLLLEMLCGLTFNKDISKKYLCNFIITPLTPLTPLFTKK
jgi:hypothetical protein